MELQRPRSPQSNNAQATLTVAELVEAGGEARLTKVCTLEGEIVTVKISPAALEYLETVASAARAGALVRSLPYCEANKRPRVTSVDFAMAKGVRTQAELDAWQKRNCVNSRATTQPTMELPPDQEETE